MSDFPLGFCVPSYLNLAMINRMKIFYLVHPKVGLLKIETARQNNEGNDNQCGRIAVSLKCVQTLF